MRKIAQTKNQTTLLHPNGHKVIIAHNNLNESMRAQLDKMPMQYMYEGGGIKAGSPRDLENQKNGAPPIGSSPPEPITGWRTGSPEPEHAASKDTWGFGEKWKGKKFANGGEADVPGLDFATTARDLSAPQQASPMPGMIQQTPVEFSDSEGSNIQASAPDQFNSQFLGIKTPGAEPTNMPLQQPPQTQAQIQASPTAGLEQQRQGIQDIGKYQGQLANQSVDVYGAHNKSIADLATLEQQNLDDYNKESGPIVQEMKDGHIRPEAYMEDMHTPGRISTAIGLILGGLGSGMTGGPNVALDFLNKQIDRNIQAQQKNLDNKATLLGAMTQRYHNKQDGIKMSRAIQLDALLTNLQESAAKLGTPMAAAQANMAAGPITQEIVNLRQQVAQRQAVIEGMRGGMDPAMAVPALVPKEHQKDVFTQIGQAQHAYQNEQNLMSAFDRAAQENTVMRTGAGHIRTPAAILEMDALNLPMIHDQEGKVNEYEQKTLQNLMPQPGDTDTKIKEKRQAYANFIQAKKDAPTAKAYGIDLPSIYMKQQPQPMRHSGR